MFKRRWEVINYYRNYMISNRGEVFSLSHAKLLKPFQNPNGYIYITLSKHGKTKCIKVHRLVAEYFVYNPDKKEYVNHKDGNKSNNYMTNLEWVTASENQKHAARNGLIYFHRGTSHHNSKLKPGDVIKIRDMYDKNIPHKEIADRFNINRRYVGTIGRRDTWKHIE